MMNKRYIALGFVIVIAIVFRFYKLGDVPVGFHRDEAFLGYNAYSLLKTGMDMTGNNLPVHLESFLFSPAGYSYASIPFITLFQLSPFSVRFASAFFGVVSVAIFYFFIVELFYQNKERYLLALVSSLFLAIAPWHINLSRTATESIVVLCLFLIGMWLYLYSLRHNHKILGVVSIFFFSSTLAVYQSPRAWLPLFLPLLFLLFPWKRTKDTMIFFVCYGLLIVLPVVLIVTHPTLSTRIRSVSIFSTEETKLVIDEQLREDGTLGIGALTARFFHNKAEAYGEVLLENFFAHLSYPFLFTDQGLPERYRVPGSGLLPLMFLPCMLLGIYLMIKHDRHIVIFLLAWLCTGLVGSALTFDDVPNLQRTVTVLPVYILFASYGITYVVMKRDSLRPWVKMGIVLCIGIGIVWETTQYMHNYYVQQVVHRPWRRQEGYKELVSTVAPIQSEYSNIVVTNEESAPALFFLFFQKYDPKTYIEEVKNSPLRDFDRVNFGKYEFVEKECPSIIAQYPDPQNPDKTIYECRPDKHTLYVESFSCPELAPCGTLLKEIKRSDGTKVFQVVSSKE